MIGLKMRRRIGAAGLFIALAMTTPSIAQAATAGQGSGLEALLKQVQQASQSQSQVLQAREQRFLQARNQQAALLQKAEADAKQAQSRADALRSQFQANEKAISDLQNKLKSASGDRGALFGAVHDAAKAFHQIASDSLVSAQYPARLKILAQIADPSRVPSVDQIRQLWFLMQQQLTASGRVVAFPAKIVRSNGDPQQTQVTRIGEFTAISSGRYLVLQPGTTQLAVLPRQPGYTSDASAFETAGAELAPILIDPSRGGLLRQQAARPTLFDRARQAGVIGYVLIAAAVLGLALALFQLIYLMRVDLAIRRQLARLETPRDDNPLGRVLACVNEENLNEDTELLETRLSEAVLRETPRLERFQAFLRMLVAAGPLLGLLGTVTGMIITFQVITEVGSGDPKLMAGGISQAMIATVLGLLVAIPLLFINSILGARSRVLVQILDEQSAGLLARRMEHLRDRA